MALNTADVATGPTDPTTGLKAEAAALVASALAAAQPQLQTFIRQEIQAIVPTLKADIQEAVTGKVTIPPPVWIAGGVVLAAIIAALSYLLVESVSFGNHAASVDLGTIATWLGLGALAGGGVLVKSPLQQP